jgi:hypothetical protein
MNIPGPKYRPIVATGCLGCFVRDVCGGLDGNANDAFGCYDRCRTAGCCADKETCDWTCPNNEEVFERRWAEVGGWLTFDSRQFPGVPLDALRSYIPQIRPGIIRDHPVGSEVVAFQLYEALRAFRKGTGYTRRSPAEFRRRLSLRDDAKVLLIGVAPDAPLEGFWSRFKTAQFPELIAEAGVLAITAPNFSSFTNVPRHEMLYNRKRMILVAEAFITVGVPVIPHFHATHHADWAFWTHFLKRQPEVNCFCKEFQTGNSNKERRDSTITAMAQMQKDAGRRLHPIMVAGRVAMRNVAEHFSSFSVVDSEPAMKTIKRRCIVSGPSETPRWTPMKSLPNGSMSRLLDHNISGYGARIATELTNQRRNREKRNERQSSNV